ncbi:MAG TPA: MFS transporter [Roseiflexaceae bacterium]|nr:MFS transporter [Roseiflexaceae bacterium]
MAQASRRRLFYGWIVVAVTALTLIVSAGVRSAPGVFLVPMLADFANDRTAISFAASLGILLFGLAGPLSGALMDRFGPRRTMLLGMALVGASMLLSARMTSLWELHLFWGVASGFGTGMASAVLGAAVASRWFVARRGLVVGLFGASTSAGQLIFVLLLAALAERFGWRASTLALGGAALAVLLPTLLLMRDDPADVGQRPYGVPADAPQVPKPTPEAGVMGRALRSWTFWLLCLTFFVCGATSNGLIGVHFIPHAVDHGIGQVMAAGALSLMGLFNFVGTIGSGWLTDRYDPRRLLFLYYGFRGLSLLLLPFTTNQAGLVAFAVLFGLDYIATVPPTAALVADTFGRRNVGTVFGWVFCAHQVGAALAAWMGGVARASLGDYALTFVAAGALAVVAAGLSLRIGRGIAVAAPATSAQ